MKRAGIPSLKGEKLSKTGERLPPGLYLVSTPIGNLGDITFRAIETLKSVDSVVCEDTRVSGRLLHHFGIEKKLMSYHEHNADKVRPKILKLIQEGQSVALISDAGTPLISDPGYKLVREIKTQNLFITAIPGASAPLMALILSGFPTDHFLFAGFVNKDDFSTLQSIPYTLIFFSTASKLLKDLRLMKDVFLHREVAVARELTKMFEEVRSGSFEEIITHYTTTPAKGEIVLLLSPPSASLEIDLKALDQDIERLKGRYGLKELSELLAATYPLKKREIYQRILEQKDKEIS